MNSTLAPVTRRPVPTLLVAVVLAAAGLSAATPAPGRQSGDWRPALLASFDDVWQTVHDTYYDPAFGGVDWDAVRVQLRPDVEHALSAAAARQVIATMIARLGQSHFVILPSAASGLADRRDPPGDDTLPGEATVPVEVRIVDNTALITAIDGDAFVERAGLHPGQSLVAIDGHDTATIIASAVGSDPRARGFDAWRRVYRALHGQTGSIATLGVRGIDGRRSTVPFARVIEAGQALTLGNLPTFHVRVATHEDVTPAQRHVGVIAFNLWMTPINQAVDDAMERYGHDDGLVIDLRGNPGGLATMITGVAGHLLREPVVLATSHMRGATLQYIANPRVVTLDGRPVEPFAGPVAVLVDELTGSTSECFAAALQSLGRVRVFGRPTMGQALAAVTKRLADGDVFMYALGDFVTSSGRRVEGNGVTPDVVVPLSASALSSGHDPTLAAALAWVDSARR
jgi:carboxyl-terminal processing protease